jgi:hypothetical protein
MYALLQGFQSDNPRLHDLLRLIVQEVQIQNAALFPPQTSIPEVITPDTDTIPDITVFNYTLIKQGIRFTWERPGSGVVFFEIRRGATWETASRQIVTSTLSAVLDPLASGSYTFWIRGVGLDGTYSVNALQLNVIIPVIGGLTVNGRVIDNNVLLTWTIPTSAFAIDYYIITRDSVQIGRQTGTFIAVFEQVSGTYQYGVQAVDIVGNVSVASVIELSVSQPPDYILEAIETSDLDGTFTNTLREATLPSLLANINLVETWAEHFTSRGWTTIQNQIDAGFPFFLQPTLEFGEYEEVFDYGAVFDNIIVNLEWNFEQIVPTMNVTTYLSTSVDNVTYTTEVAGITLFATSLRYLKVRFEFEAQN